MGNHASFQMEVDSPSSPIPQDTISMAPLPHFMNGGYNEAPDAEQRRLAAMYLTQIRHRTDAVQDEVMNRLVFLARVCRTMCSGHCSLF